MDLETGKRWAKPSSLVRLKLPRGGLSSVEARLFCGTQAAHPAIGCVLRREQVSSGRAWRMGQVRWFVVDDLPAMQTT